jgi:3-hydroxyisobutyrate dehydrogenase-like beta-hydroxyacid dehydrogenase
MTNAVGLVGIGLMGTALARRLLAAGFPVVGFDTDPAKRRALEDMGGQAAGSLAEIGDACSVVLIAVLTTDQVEQVVEGPSGLLSLPRAAEPRMALCFATCDPGRLAALAQRAERGGLVLLDTPVSGTSEQVLRGDGLGLIAGDAAAIERVGPMLDAVVPRRFVIGPAGDGSKAKLAVNLILGLNRLALAEGLVFAERLGLDLRAFLEVARASAAYSQIMDVKGEKMIAGDWAPHGKITQHLKDVRIMLAEAERIEQRLPLGEVLVDVLQSCVDHGEGERDNCASIEEMRRRRTSVEATRESRLSSR